MRLSLILRAVFNRSTMWALLLALIILLLVIAITDTSPLWIYQGF